MLNQGNLEDMKINWRSIKEHGLPKDRTIGYLVCDAENNIEYSDINSYNEWTGGSVYATYDMSNEYFDFFPTHWCPTKELNTPEDERF